MMLGEIAPGGTGSGLYGMLILAIVTVFVAGLMVGRTPEYLGKKIGAREMKYAALYILTTPAVVLVFTGLAMALPGETRLDARTTGPARASPRSRTPSPRWATTTARPSPASAGNTHWWNTAGALAMMFGRFLPMICVLALAGSLAKQKPVPATEGTLKTALAAVRGDAAGHRPAGGRPHLLPGPVARAAR